MSITDQSTAVTATSSGITVTAGSTANTKGAYVEAIASTSEETYWLQLCINGAIALQDDAFVIDIAVGAASSEVIVIADIPVFLNFTGTVMLPPMPITIASGARVSVRAQSQVGSSTMQFMMQLSNNSEFGTSTVNESVGVITSGSSKGTPVLCNSTINTKGSYAELDASTTISANYCVVMYGNNINLGQTTMTYLYDLSIGAASSEVDQIVNGIWSSGSAELPSGAQGFFLDIPSSSRVAARGQTNTFPNATDSTFDIAVILFAITPPTGGGGGIAQIVGQGGIVG